MTNDILGSCVRQILTARKGQRPTTWLDFEEVRQVMLGWDGYKIMCISSSVSIDELRKSLAIPAPVVYAADAL